MDLSTFCVQIETGESKGASCMFGLLQIQECHGSRHGTPFAALQQTLRNLSYGSQT